MKLAVESGSKAYNKITDLQILITALALQHLHGHFHFLSFSNAPHTPIHNSCAFRAFSSLS